ncbi:methylenetetrahydrofolate reductase C-terminal domain-containing protein, partial [bacterium]|nr:methylenetetrahydrofolate reductase C-terminal domain-containing protein [bacterium]
MLERRVKGPIYGCRMCGNCLLQETAFICPMECPKGLRNGPCGGSTPEYCYVDETRPCVWYKIYERAFETGREEKLLEVLPPLDWEQVGTETWGDVYRQARQIGFGGLFKDLRNRETRPEARESVFRPVRQPDWWRGDAEYHPPAYDEPASELERRLRAGEFVVTSEVAPPMGSATGKLIRDIEMIRPYVASVNFTDSP